MLNHALRVLFCIAPPSHCVLWQQPGLIWGVRAGQPPAPLEWKNSGAQINKNEYHTRTASFFYAVFSYTSRNGAALAARVLWRHKKEFFDLLISHIQAQKTFFELPFKAHLQALRGIWAIHFREPGPAPISPANGGMKRSLWSAGGLRKKSLLSLPRCRERFATFLF